MKSVQDICCNLTSSTSKGECPTMVTRRPVWMRVHTIASRSVLCQRHKVAASCRRGSKFDHLDLSTRKYLQAVAKRAPAGCCAFYSKLAFIVKCSRPLQLAVANQAAQPAHFRCLGRHHEDVPAHESIQHQLQKGSCCTAVGACSLLQQLAPGAGSAQHHEPRFPCPAAHGTVQWQTSNSRQLLRQYCCKPPGHRPEEAVSMESQQ